MNRWGRILGCCLMVVALSACGERGPAPAPVAAGPTAEDGEFVPAEQSVATPAAPAVAPAPAVTPTPAAPAKPDMKALERLPGHTPALTQQVIPSGPPHSDLAGRPGPSPGAGPPTAKVKVVVFSDFQCPVCRRAVEPLKALVREFPEDLQLIFKQNALEMHANALIAAAASTAAARQGKFWEYHDLLFQNQRALSDGDLARYAEQLGLDMARFNADRGSEEVLDQLLYEREMAEHLDARGTPAFFVNGKKLVGWGSHRGFRGMITRAMAAVKPSPDTPAERRAMVATAANGDDGKKLAAYLWGGP